MNDHVYSSFLERQNESLSTLASQSRVLRYRAIQSHRNLPANLFITSMTCAHVVKKTGEPRVSHAPCSFGIQLPADYLRRSYPDSGQILSLISPAECFHPNVRWPHICIGPVAAGTSVVELVLRVDEILTFNRVNPREDDCMNPSACPWTRAHMDDFPLERRPLRDRSAEGRPVESIVGAGG